MKNMMYNMGYFFREVRTIIKLNLMSNVFSLLSIGLIFFILAMVVSGWRVSGMVVEAIKDEAEVSVYFNEQLKADEIKELVEAIADIPQVREARLVDADEAYGRMEKILGKEARVLGYFEDNPFSPFIEVKIDIEGIDPILEEMSYLIGIEHIRDNREVLGRISSITAILGILGSLVVTAVGISTMVIVSHIIRMGIYENREQINTLRLMGAPESFIGFPFMLEGLMLTIGGGALASMLMALLLKYMYSWVAGPLPFIPLPSPGALTGELVILVMILSILMGMAGGWFGLSSARSR